MQALLEQRRDFSLWWPRWLEAVSADGKSETDVLVLDVMMSLVWRAGALRILRERSCKPGS